MTNSHEISQAARAAYRVGFGASTNVIVLGVMLAAAIVMASIVHGIIVRPPVVMVTRDDWKCQVATNPKVALCRIPEDPLPRP
jgi:hypothetical protein